MRNAVQIVRDLLTLLQSCMDADVEMFSTVKLIIISQVLFLDDLAPAHRSPYHVWVEYDLTWKVIRHQIAFEVRQRRPEVKNNSSVFPHTLDNLAPIFVQNLILSCLGQGQISHILLDVEQSDIHIAKESHDISRLVQVEGEDTRACAFMLDSGNFFQGNVPNFWIC